MLQKTRKTLSFKKIMVYKIPPGGEVNHTWPLAIPFFVRGSGDIKEKHILRVGYFIHTSRKRKKSTISS